MNMMITLILTCAIFYSKFFMSIQLSKTITKNLMPGYFVCRRVFFLLFQPWKASYPWPAYIYRIVNVCLLDFISSLFLPVECLKHFTKVLAIYVWTQLYYFQTQTIHQKSKLAKNLHLPKNKWSVWIAPNSFSFGPSG